MLYAASGPQGKALPVTMPKPFVFCLLWPRSSCVIHVGPLVLNSSALPSTREREALNYLCGTFPCLLAADHVQAGDVWAGSDIERPAMVCVIFPVDLLFVASGALTVQGCP